jgi:8-oxo-(d)GTP phosphatase
VDTLVHAAGGVLHRPTGSGAEIAVVHRPRHDDWSLPKGKRKRGEHPVVNAYREVWEETGVRAYVGPRLPSVSYRVPLTDGTWADKTVDYWAMTYARDDGFTPGHETDELRWFAVADALARLTYERDVFVVKAFAALPALRAPTVLLRHASAGERTGWSSRDDQRPLDAPGRERSRELEAVLSCFGPARLLSAEPVRCVETLAPLGHGSGLPVVVDRHFDDQADPEAATRRLVGLSHLDGATVVCSQGKLIPAVLAVLTGDRALFTGDRAVLTGDRADFTGGRAGRYHTAKGSGWVLSFGADDSLVALDTLD